MGDFNYLLEVGDKVGGVEVIPSNYKEFYDCTQDAHIFDLRYTGCFFTWNNKQEGDYKIASKIDRIMVNMEWVEAFSDSTAEFLLSGISDHSPEAVKTYAKLARYEESINKEKSKVQWMEDGDLNTRFFYNSVKETRSRNNILVLNSGEDIKLEDDKLIGEECVNFFSDLFSGDSSQGDIQEVLNKLHFNRFIHPCDVEKLVMPISRDEVIEDLSSIHFSKARGPDGFNSYFFKSAWPVVGDDFVAAITNFFKTGKLLKEVNNTLITLVAKCENASTVFDFRPISCCSVIYKCLTKILSYRMKIILKGLISSSQSAFISGRSIQDNILLAHEIVRNYHKSGGSPRCDLKIDLQKAYDAVSWEAIVVVMRKFGFPERFIDWVMVCISTSKFFVMINGPPYGFFGAQIGV
ncbi:uncharacterized protein LOC113315436 [Papaver somniferum]|uniref:uncharacterized protein LOC113315436 n=1 Tax=Papaver somniferum TaxID=3469 RepID=UPI000E704042|nr:uncharacterized protein LOC113315436 [Papaver somniferum]